MSNLADFDIFYFYGQNDLQTEIESDIQQLVVQNSRSLFYNRANDSAGLDEFENVPNAVSQAIMVAFNIVASLAKRNTYVGNGQEGTRDHRIAVSQNSISVEQVGAELDISIFYIPLFNIDAGASTTVKLPSL